MLTKLTSLIIEGINSREIQIEVDVASRGFPCFDIVGLGDKSIVESKQRIRTAITNSGLKFTFDKRVTVNLAPANVSKEGSHFDIAVAVGLLNSVYKYSLTGNELFLGELSLEGTARMDKSVFFYVQSGLEHGFKNIFVPKSCRKFLNDIYIQNKDNDDFSSYIYLYNDLFELHEHFASGKILEQFISSPYSNENFALDPKDSLYMQIVGQEKAKKALLLCASGGHNLIMIGSQGAGKSMLAKSICELLPNLTHSEKIEVKKIYSVVGRDTYISAKPPFRSPHHTVSYSGMLGGGSKLKPGEVTLAHLGILFLDELVEFKRDCVEALRQPIEDKFVTITRSIGSIIYPSNFTLVAACNPCPCGNLGHFSNKCICSSRQVHNYRKKLSGPILDRIDIHLNIYPVDSSLLLKKEKSKKPSLYNDVILASKLVNNTRKIQIQRFEHDNICLNSEMTPKQIKKYCEISAEGLETLDLASKNFNFSSRSYYKIIKVARTLLDMQVVQGTKNTASLISKENILEALQFREKI